MIAFRLDPQLKQTINELAWKIGVSRSELIRRSIVEYVAKFEKPSAWELGKNVFGKYASKNSNLAGDRKKLAREIIKTKR